MSLYIKICEYLYFDIGFFILKFRFLVLGGGGES